MGPLYRAIQAGRDDIVRILVERGAKTNILDEHDVTCQHMAAFHGHVGMSWWLYYKGAWKNRFAKLKDEETKKVEEKQAPKKAEAAADSEKKADAEPSGAAESTAGETAAAAAPPAPAP